MDKVNKNSEWKNKFCNICQGKLGTTSNKLICSSCNRHLNMKSSNVNSDTKNK